MTTLLLNTMLVLVMIFFGAMAYYPLFIKGEDTELQPDNMMDDRVISVVPSELGRQAPKPITPINPTSDDSEHPGHCPAA